MYNSDGYILIDLYSADMGKPNQYMPGLYHRVTKDCLGVNKLALVINAGDLTPMSAVINKSLNYYVITTSLYIFKINSNDILIIEEAGSSTVEVAIVPTLIEGTKIADFQVGSTTGELLAPTQQSEINDNVPSDHTTYSSDKINTLLSGKANSSDLATVATTGSYTDLTNKPTIPTKVSELQNDSGYVPSSSLATVATTGSYTDLTNKPTIPTKVSELQNDSGYITDSALSDYQPKTDNTLDTTAKTITGAINELNTNKGEPYWHGSTAPSNDFNSIIGTPYSDGFAYWVNFSQMSNSPQSSGYGYLEIIGSMQRVTVYNTGIQYMRSFVNSSWSDWFKGGSFKPFSETPSAISLNGTLQLSDNIMNFCDFVNISLRRYARCSTHTIPISVIKNGDCIGGVVFPIEASGEYQSWVITISTTGLIKLTQKNGGNAVDVFIRAVGFN